MIWGEIADLVAGNAGMQFEAIVCLIMVLGSIVFVAKDFKLGLVSIFVSMSGVFIWFYSAGMEWWLPLTILLLSLVVMTLGLLATDKTSPTGGIT